MITAKKAMELTKDNAEKIEKVYSFWHKFKLIWYCGLIDKKIEKAIKQGKDEVEIKWLREDRYDKYYSDIQSIYMALGYYVGFKNHGPLENPWIIWKNEDRMKLYEKRTFNDYFSFSKTSFRKMDDGSVQKCSDIKISSNSLAGHTDKNGWYKGAVKVINWDVTSTS